MHVVQNISEVYLICICVNIFNLKSTHFVTSCSAFLDTFCTCKYNFLFLMSPFLLFKIINKANLQFECGLLLEI